MAFFNKAHVSPNIWATFMRKVYHRELSKYAQSGHTASIISTYVTLEAEVKYSNRKINFHSNFRSWESSVTGLMEWFEAKIGKMRSHWMPIYCFWTKLFASTLSRHRVVKQNEIIWLKSSLLGFNFANFNHYLALYFESFGHFLWF